MSVEPTWATRFWAKVDMNGPIPEQRPDLGPCHIWTAATMGRGYGKFWLDGRLQGAHRAALRLVGVDIPEGWQVDHLCRNEPCVRPSHLEPVTPQINTLRGNGAGALVARTNLCKRGHEYTDENTIRSRDGRRSCLTCCRMHSRRYRRERKLWVYQSKERP